ncbi:hypothetical protein Franean1_4380 [Parafrankia sp. EAN1pec]|nr:hypothetical protein Franean1_4380 [Frankia sp. EAN1pec]
MLSVGGRCFQETQPYSKSPLGTGPQRGRRSWHLRSPGRHEGLRVSTTEQILSTWRNVAMSVRSGRSFQALVVGWVATESLLILSR